MLLHRYMKEFSTTLKILQYHKHKVLPKLYMSYIPWLGENGYFCEDNKTSTKLTYYLEVYGDILIFAELPENL
ncbi:MAG: hypothetical protein NC218_10015 [Acetobacter sp.]|nr:hypothetical protein [Acetobacter sp.]